MSFCNSVIISPPCAVCLFVWTNLNFRHTWMHCVKFGLNWPSGSEEGENMKRMVVIDIKLDLGHVCNDLRTRHDCLSLSTVSYRCQIMIVNKLSYANIWPLIKLLWHQYFMYPSIHIILCLSNGLAYGMLNHLSTNFAFLSISKISYQYFKKFG